MKVIDKKLIEEVEVEFSDLLTLYNKILELKEKCKKYLDAMPDSNYTNHLLDNYDQTIYTFMLAAKNYYYSADLDYESLKAKFLEEKKYRDQTLLDDGKIQLLMDFYKNSVSGYDDQEEFNDYDEEIEKDELLSLKQGN